MRRLLIAIMALSIASCAAVRGEKSSFRTLGVEEFARYIEQEDVLLVDVRSSEEFVAGHLEGVDRLLDVRSATFFTDFKALPKDKTIALYCKGGGRSKQVAGVLAGNGYRVVELGVGYDGWQKAGMPTRK